MKTASLQAWPAMRKARPFEGLPDGLLDSILQSGTVRTCLNGVLLIGQGDTPEHMLLVLDGQLRTFMTGEDGKEVTLRMLDPGASCMGVALFMGKLSPVAVDAVGNARILQLPARFVKRLVIQNPRFAENMLRIAAANYRGVIEQIDAVALRTPFQRIGHYLLVEFISSGSDELTFELRFKKSLIASHLGMTPETLSRGLVMRTSRRRCAISCGVMRHSSGSCDPISSRICTASNRSKSDFGLKRCEQRSAVAWRSVNFRPPNGRDSNLAEFRVVVNCSIFI